MWICKKCNSELDDDSVEFCWNCGEAKNKKLEDWNSLLQQDAQNRFDEEPIDKGEDTWTCQSCNTEVEKEFEFCSNCGAPKEPPKPLVPLPKSEQNAPAPPIMMKPRPSMTPSSVIIQAPAVQPPSNYKHEDSVFASQFAEWDLLPPVVPIRRVSRTL